MEDNHLPLPSVREMGEMELVVSDSGKLYLFHKAPMPATIEWAEYDTEMASLYFVSDDGRTQDCGIKIHDPMKVHMLKSASVYTIKVEDDFSTSAICEVSLVIR